MVSAADTEEPPENKKERNQNMKTLTKLVLSVAMLIAAVVSANAQTAYGYSGYSSSSRDFVYRNPYAAMPTVGVHDYFRRDGSYVAPYVRTAPNWTQTDNLSYRGYGTIRVPRSTSGW